MMQLLDHDARLLFRREIALLQCLSDTYIVLLLFYFFLRKIKVSLS